MRRWAPPVAALGAVAAVVIPYAALGGGSYKPTPLADPCVAREWRDPGDLESVLEQIVLSALDGAACELGVSREDLVLAFRDEASLDAFAEEHDVTRADAENAVENGLARSVDDAEDAGALPSFAASLARRVVESVPPWLLLDAIESLGGLLP